MKDIIVVVGVGIAGVTAALAAAKTGMGVLLIGNEGNAGGDACTGMPLLGTYSSRGEKCVGGILDELLAICKTIPGGYIGPVCDYRTVYGLCVSPSAMRLAILLLLKKYEVNLLLNSTVTDIESENGKVNAVNVVCGNGEKRRFECRSLVDASGGGNIVKMAGGNVLCGDANGNMQPVSLIFRMAGVKFEPFLRFIMENPEEALLSENPVFETDRTKAAELLYRSGYPYVALAAQGKLLGKALQKGEMYPCTAMFMTPVSMQTGEICVNSTRIAQLDASCPETASKAVLDLAGQVQTAVKFLCSRVPGFEKAVLSSVASRLGVRETGRIVGDHTLSQEEAVSGKRHASGIGRGAHHIDIHGAGTAQVRIPIKDGRTYDIPFGCLLPAGLENVIAAGRCISSDRGGNGSARVMGTCMVTGQAAGLAAALAAESSKDNMRGINIDVLRRRLTEQGAIL
ncbi:MAG: FAD-dependent oxidoreductase [Victivallales bacterium]